MPVCEEKAQTNVRPRGKILLVTPVWRDAGRLAGFGTGLAKALAECDHDVDWVIADDGSGPEQQEKLIALRERLGVVFPGVSLHFAKEHRGKGSVVREAWATHPEADWLAFVDADGSVAAEELIRMLATAEAAGETVLAIRKRTEHTQLHHTLPRAIAHRLFVIAVRILLGVPCEDPQCGAKVLRGAAYRAVAGSLQEDGMAFDAELLTALAESGAGWKELPVTWIEKGGGQVRVTRDAWAMLAALWRIRARRKGGAFGGAH